MDKKKIYLILAAVILLVGIILALTSVLVSSTIYDGEIAVGIGLHVTIITAIVFISTACLYMYTKTISNDNGISKSQYITLGCLAFSGFFFALASGYHGRAAFLSEYYDYAKSTPSGYLTEVLSSEWFPSIPGIAAGFSSMGTTWYIITFIASIATIFMAFKAFSLAKKK